MPKELRIEQRLSVGVGAPAGQRYIMETRVQHDAASTEECNSVPVCIL